ncbi:MAG: 2-succinyl-5-enolpyruvyl-6-hydroxy-3-cyclohexene-1-carboxylic-acid synthase [Corynebacterium sp.]|nr:2-succinyl-5-enolpyruvyl-6-hydroxy-3-cyclohexene-1-carboxylic-acid synthase [Corynebacterium sp.]
MTTSPELARHLAAHLAQHLTDIVLCPGSRNSPLSLALLARDDIRVHVRIDERSAAFLALGLARATGRPAGVVVTSGTAVANCHPAMIEARYSHVPLVIISGDRPPRLHGTGANQTIEQHNVLGVATCEIAELADFSTLDFTQGATHINVAFDEPLLTTPEALEPVILETAQPQRTAFVDYGEIALDISRNTLVIAGDEAWEVPGLEDVPTIAEPSAPAPYNPVHPLAANVFHADSVSAEGYTVTTKPTQVVVVGHPTLHRGVLQLLQDPEIELYVLSRTDTVTDLAQCRSGLGSRVKVTGTPTKQWLQVCEAAAQLAADSVRDVLASDYGFTGLHVAAAVADTLGTNDTLFLGSSNPVRDASFVGLPFAGVDCFSARGAAGIDGSVSQAIGIALAQQYKDITNIRANRTVALIGDITFLHEVGGLLTGVDAQPENLTIVVANDAGGGIFETLEIGDAAYRQHFEQAVGTPHQVDFAALADAYQVEFHQVDTLQSLIEALIDTTDAGGFHLIEAKTTRSTRRAMHQDLQARMVFQA